MSRLREIYPRGWLDRVVAQAIGNNIREKKNRLNMKFKVYKGKKGVSKPYGCFEESFNILYENYKANYRKEKFGLRRKKQLERLIGGKMYSHKYGREVIQSIVD